MCASFDSLPALRDVYRFGQFTPSQRLSAEIAVTWS